MDSLRRCPPLEPGIDPLRLSFGGGALKALDEAILPGGKASGGRYTPEMARFIDR